MWPLFKHWLLNCEDYRRFNNQWTKFRQKYVLAKSE
jgi:hypothetical protein